VKTRESAGNGQPAGMSAVHLLPSLFGRPLLPS
jgi:hypothetical protein